MSNHEFESFSSIKRLSRGCVITEKIDGTNAQIFIADDCTTILAGSRTRWIQPGKQTDNHGFAAWVEEHREELLKLGPGRHFGEWWGSGIQRRYDMKEKRFSLFNTGRWTNNPRPDCCHLVPVLFEGPFNDTAVETQLERLAEHGSIASPGFMNPEGIVLYHMASRTLFKKTLKGDGHKGG